MIWAITNIQLTFVIWSFCWHSGLRCATYYFAAYFLCIREFATRKISLTSSSNKVCAGTATDTAGDLL